MRARKAAHTMKRELRIYFATDIHGSEACFRKFLAAAKVYEADVIMIGGDFAGKALVPVLSDGGMLNVRVGGQNVTVGEEDWDKLRAEVTKGGFYPVRMTGDEVAELEADPDKLEQLFKDEIRGQVRRWSDLAAERLDPSVRCIITPGNDDPAEADAVLAASDRIESPEFELCDLGPLTMVSVGVVPVTPWNTERECSEDELAKLITE